MPEEEVSLRTYVEALVVSLDQRVTELAVLRKAQVDEQIGGLARRLDESAADRAHLRDEVARRVSRSELDQVLTRIGNVERTLNRIQGALALIVLLASILGVLLRYLVG